MIQQLAKVSGWKAADIKPEYGLFTELGFDSLDIAEIIAFLQMNFMLSLCTCTVFDESGDGDGIAAQHLL